jgi:hypothetical protein
MRCWTVVLGLLGGILSVAPVSAQSTGAPSTPALGGTPEAFETVLGGPSAASVGSILYFEQCAGTDLDQFVLMTSNDQVWTIERSYCDVTTHSADERFADAAHYLPPDAVASIPFTDDLGEQARTFVSATLGQNLPAALFHDCSGSSVAAGTLFIVADSTGGWYMGPGSCPGG